MLLLYKQLFRKLEKKVANKFGVSCSTLHDYVKKDRNRADNDDFQLGSYSSAQVLSSNMERDLAAYLQRRCSALCHGLSSKATRKLAYDYAIANKITVPQSWVRDESAGKDWLTGFLERQKDLSLRSPEATGLTKEDQSSDEELLVDILEEEFGDIEPQPGTSSSVEPDAPVPVPVPAGDDPTDAAGAEESGPGEEEASGSRPSTRQKRSNNTMTTHFSKAMRTLEECAQKLSALGDRRGDEDEDEDLLDLLQFIGTTSTRFDTFEREALKDELSQVIWRYRMWHSERVANPDNPPKAPRAPISVLNPLPVHQYPSSLLPHYHTPPIMPSVLPHQQQQQPQQQQAPQQ